MSAAGDVKQQRGISSEWANPGLCPAKLSFSSAFVLVSFEDAILRLDRAIQASSRAPITSTTQVRVRLRRF